MFYDVYHHFLCPFIHSLSVTSVSRVIWSVDQEMSLFGFSRCSQFKRHRHRSNCPPEVRRAKHRETQEVRNASALSGDSLPRGALSCSLMSDLSLCQPALMLRRERPTQEGRRHQCEEQTSFHMCLLRDTVDQRQCGSDHAIKV